MKFSIEPTITKEYIQALKTIADYHKELAVSYTALAAYLEAFVEKVEKADAENTIQSQC